MSERSNYFRDQAAKCSQHADKITAPETQDELRKLAAVYVPKAVEIEGKE